MNELGDLLKRLRGKKSLRDVAELTELSHTYIADVEKGYRRGSKTPINPSPDTLKRLASAYNYSYKELMEVAGYIEGDSSDTENDRPLIFAKRLRSYFDKDDVSIQEVAEKCNVTTEYITKLMTSPSSLPGVGTLYKLADLLNVTPDYLGGFTTDPKGHSVETPRPRDMQEFLEKEEVMLFGEILDGEDKDKLNNILAAVFLDAKKKNKRK